MAVLINGIKVLLDDPTQIDALKTAVTSKNVVIKEDDVWEVEGNNVMTRYTFETFIETAKKLSNQKPLDVTMFSETLWRCGAFLITKFCLDNFEIFVKTHTVRKVIAELLADASIEGGTFMRAWQQVERLHNKFDSMNFIDLENRSAAIENICELREMISECKPADVHAEILQSLILCEVESQEDNRNAKHAKYANAKMKVKYYAYDVKKDHKERLR